MTCEHLAKLNEFVKENGIELSSYDLIRVVCTKCKLQAECESIPAVVR